MRRLACALVAVVALAAAGCSSCGKKTESAVDVPVKLDDVRKLAKPPRVVVSVERKEAAGGGAACGHSPVCLLVIPAAIWGALFPPKWDEASVVEDGKLAYLARFETNGDFIESTQYRDDGIRYFGALALKQLGRRFIVQIGEARLGSDGAPADMRRVAILPQIDLVAEYEKALAHEADAEDRAALVVEAATWLGDESLAFLEKHAKDAHEPDASRAAIVNGACALEGARRDRALASAREAPGPKTAMAGLRCASAAGREEDVAAFIGIVASDLCHASTASDADDLADALPRGAAAVAAAGDRCDVPAARTLLRLRGGAAVPRVDLEAAMRDSGPFTLPLVALLRPREPDERAALFAGLAAQPSLEQIVTKLAEAQIAPTSPELRTLVASYAADGPLFDAPRRQTVLGLFDRAYRAKVDTADARADLDALAAKAKDGDRPLFRAAQMVLGDRARAASASRGLGAHSSRAQRSGGTDDASVVGLAFFFAGCSEREVDAAYLAARKYGDADRAPLCTKP